jgi:hypothetical protein
MIYYDLQKYIIYTMPNREIQRFINRAGGALSALALLGLLTSCPEPVPASQANATTPPGTPSHLTIDRYGEQNPETDSIAAIFDDLMKAHLPRLATEYGWTVERSGSILDAKGIQSRFSGVESLVPYHTTSFNGTDYQVYLFPKSEQLKRKGDYAVIPDSPHVVLVKLGQQGSEAYLTDNQKIIDRVLQTIYADIPSLSTREMQVLSTESQLAMRVIQRQWQAKGMGTVRIEDYLFAPDSNWEHDKENGVWLRPLIKAPKTCLTGC